MLRCFFFVNLIGNIVSEYAHELQSVIQDQQEENNTDIDKREVVEEFHEPYQPTCFPDTFPKEQRLKTRTLTFQVSWYMEFKWLHVAKNCDGVSCFYCTRYLHICPDKVLASKMETAFTGRGFKNWKKALDKFREHERSEAHSQALLSYSQLKNPIERQLSTFKMQQQRTACECLMIIIRTLRYLVRQGLAIRGHAEDDGNFMVLLKERSEDIPALKAWLKHEQGKPIFTHPDIQNEIIQILGNEVLASVLENIKSSTPLVFSVICDGTRDITGDEQESICLRWCDGLEPTESFLGFYKTQSTTGKAIASIISDSLLRLGLPLSCLRGQAYDGAGNMKGSKKGAQSIIIDNQPLAEYVHCVAHCCNLIMKKCCDASSVVKNAMDWANQLGIMFGRAKVKPVFIHLCEEAARAPVGNISKIKPLCPTRWIYRKAQVEEIVKKYNIILDTLRELSEDNYDGSSGLLHCFSNGLTYLGFVLAKDVIDLLELLNKSFQGRKKTLSGTVRSVQTVLDSLSNLRGEDKFTTIFNSCCDKIDELGLEPLALPRTVRPPKRFCGPGKQHEWNSCEEYFRQEYYKVIETAMMGLQEGVIEQSGVQKIVMLENVLITGENTELLNPYPEVDPEALKLEIKLFLKNNSISCLSDAVTAFKEMVPEVRNLFRNVECLVKLLLVSPASSCEAERSFSALRRLKSYLRTTMSQPRLNQVALCYVHKERLDKVDIRKVAQLFVSRKDYRKSLFGSVGDENISLH